ncbi:MAG: hypothetical protein Tsb0017_11200 [Geothermobacteraceae bacterium]
MSLKCWNDGGADSRLTFDLVPESEVPVKATSEQLQALKCWRARQGQILTFVDPELRGWRTRLEARSDGLWLVPFEELDAPPESPLAIDLYYALPDRERFELVLEKATELGVGRIIPFESRHSNTLAERDARQKKSHRWPDVLLRAALQCRRAMLPCLAPVIDWDGVLYHAAQADLRLVLYEKERSWRLREALEAEGRPRRVAIVVGAEGGFDEEEIEQARGAGILPVSLGSRILRTETAAIAGLALLQARYGDLG